jgi:hypothetical protein
MQLKYKMYYNNNFDANNKGKRILDMDKLYEGQIYLLDMHGIHTCGQLIEKSLSDLPERINYYSMYFKIGTAKYDKINMVNMINQYHLQSHLNLPAMQLYIYEYHLANQLQYQIKHFWYYKKSVNNLCKELHICEDIEKVIYKYLIK